MTHSLSFWLQMSESIAHMDTDNYKEMMNYHSLWLLLYTV